MELPLTHHELYRQIGIDPPRGVLLYGPPGTGKTMLAKAVAHHTTAAFIRVVGSEFVQKYLGEVRQPLLFATSRNTVRQLCESYFYNYCSSCTIMIACIFGRPQVCPIKGLSVCTSDQRVCYMTCFVKCAMRVSIQQHSVSL